MDEIMSDFYITLPSNSSMKHFPENTQSSYRTKLSAPLILSGDDWEVGLSEIFIPKSWYNIDGHNNAYSITSDVEERIPREPEERVIDVILETDMNILDFCFKINNEIVKRLNSDNVKFQPQKDKIIIELALGYEVRILKDFSPKILGMLDHSSRDLIITETKNFKYKTPSGPRTREKITVINKHIASLQEIPLPTNRIKPRGEYFQTGKKLAEDFNENLRLLDLEDKIKFSYSPETRELHVVIAEDIKINLDKKTAPTLMQKLNVNLDSANVFNRHTFQTDPAIEVKSGETMTIIMPVYIEDVKKSRKKIDFHLNPGLYKTNESLFSAFERINLTLLPNMKVSMRISPSHEVTLSKGLAEMLGFTNIDFKEGEHISAYPLALDAGITEIYVYSDLVTSHHVGDTFAPLLRVVPARSENPDEIVKHYDRPLYFPLKKNFWKQF